MLEWVYMCVYTYINFTLSKNEFIIQDQNWNVKKINVYRSFWSHQPIDQTIEEAISRHLSHEGEWSKSAKTNQQSPLPH